MNYMDYVAEENFLYTERVFVLEIWGVILN